MVHRTCIFHLSLPFSLRRHIKKLLSASQLNARLSFSQGKHHASTQSSLSLSYPNLNQVLPSLPIQHTASIHAVYTWPFIYRYGTLGARKSASCLNFFHVHLTLAVTVTAASTFSFMLNMLPGYQKLSTMSHFFLSSHVMLSSATSVNGSYLYFRLENNAILPDTCLQFKRENCFILNHTW